MDHAQNIQITAKVKNIGRKAGDEVVQLYLRHPKAKLENTLIPQIELKGFQRISLQPGEEQEVHFTLTPEQYSLVNSLGKHEILVGKTEISLGGNQPQDWTPSHFKSSPTLLGEFTIAKKEKTEDF
jgi:beta-glucosidase